MNGYQSERGTSLGSVTLYPADLIVGQIWAERSMAMRRCWSATGGWGRSKGMVVGGLPVCGTSAS